MRDTSYDKSIYDIDLNSLIPELDKIINSQTLSPKLKITKKEYIERLSSEADRIKKLLGYKNEPHFVLKRPQVHFDYWLAIYLSTQKPHKIALILDYHFVNDKDPRDFVNHVQHMVIEHFDDNIFHDVESQLKEISKWVREKRKELQPENTDSSNEVDDENNLVTKDETRPSILIDSPYDNILFKALVPFCEENSIENLRTLILGGTINTPVVLKMNFKKISLLRPVNGLIVRFKFKMSRVDASTWIGKNFEIRGIEKNDTFAFSSTEKRIGGNIKEPKHAQIKYEHWFKKDPI